MRTHLRHRALLLLAAASLGLAACRVDATVDVHVEPDGSGTVTVALDLDADAVRATEVGGGKLEDRVRLSDLAAAGWSMGTWTRAEDGGASIALSKGFADPEALPEVLAELGGPVRGGRLEVDESSVRTRYRLELEADLAAVVPGVTADPELVAALAAAGVDPAAVEARLAAGLDDVVALRLRGELPGGAVAEAAVEPGAAGELTVRSTTLELRRLVLVTVGVLLAVAAVALLVVGERRHARRARRARSSPPRSYGP